MSLHKTLYIPLSGGGGVERMGATRSERLRPQRLSSITCLPPRLRATAYSNAKRKPACQQQANMKSTALGDNNVQINPSTVTITVQFLASGRLHGQACALPVESLPGPYRWLNFGGHAERSCWTCSRIGGKGCPGSREGRCTGWCVRCCPGSGSDRRSCCGGWKTSSGATSGRAAPMRNATPPAAKAGWSRHPKAVVVVLVGYACRPDVNRCDVV